MLASITPLGERGRGSRWAVTIVAFGVGATAGGLVVGAAAGGLGTVVLPASVSIHARLIALAVVLACAALLDARADPAPGPRRQVNERWLDEFRGWVYGAGFGAQLGLGLTTVITSAATYAWLLAAVLTRSLVAGAVIGACFGIVRGLTPLAAAGVHSPRELLSLHRAFARWRAPGRWAGVALLVAGAGVGVVGGLS